MKEKIYWASKGISVWGLLTSIIFFIVLALNNSQAKLHSTGCPPEPWWKYILVVCIAIICFLFFFLFEELEEREKEKKNKIKIHCECGSWFEELITDQDRGLGGKNAVCPFCKSTMWIPFKKSN